MRLLAAALALLTTTAAFAQPLPTAPPEQLGFSVGDYLWNGANGTARWNDPKERLVVVNGTVAPGEIRKYYREQMSVLVYGAMTQLRNPH